MELPTRTKNRKPEICSNQIRNSELYVHIREWAVDSQQATAKFKMGQGVQFHFLEGCFDMRDLGAVFAHEGPLPHPVEDRQPQQLLLLLARGPTILGCPSEPRTHDRWNCANSTKTKNLRKLKVEGACKQ